MKTINGTYPLEANAERIHITTKKSRRIRSSLQSKKAINKDNKHIKIKNILLFWAERNPHFFCFQAHTPQTLKTEMRETLMGEAS